MRKIISVIKHIEKENLEHIGVAILFLFVVAFSLFGFAFIWAQ